MGCQEPWKASSAESVEEISPTQKDVNDEAFLEEPQRNSNAERLYEKVHCCRQEFCNTELSTRILAN
jgi:hypothetical protein